MPSTIEREAVEVEPTGVEVDAGTIDAGAIKAGDGGGWRDLFSNIVFASPLVTASAVVLALIVLAALLAPWIAPHDPIQLEATERLKPSSATYPLGTDAFGRDLLSRVIYGARISLAVGVGAALASTLLGLAVGLLTGYVKWIDSIVMRVVDGLMAIPSILLAIAVVALSGASLTTVLIAITIPEVRGVVRLVRSVVLSAREEPYVEAAIAAGSPMRRILWRHMMPNTIPPLIVQGTYVCASAILVESILSFLGAGISPETADLGQHHGRGPDLLPAQALLDLLARPRPLAHHPLDQPARRRRPRRARPAHGRAGRGPMSGPVLAVEDLGRRRRAGRARPPRGRRRVARRRGGRDAVRCRRERLGQVGDGTLGHGPVAQGLRSKPSAAGSGSATRNCSVLRPSGCAACARPRWR